jgi:site-specific DNA recombinase
VWDAIADLLKHPEQILAAWESDTSSSTKPNEVTRLQKRLDKLERQWTRLLDAYQDGLIEKSDLSDRKSRLDQDRHTLSEQIDQIQRQQTQQQVQDQIMSDFATFCDMIQASLDNPTPQVKQEVLRLLIKEIIVGDDMVTIKHIIPVDDFSRLLPRDSMQKPPNCEQNLLS